MEPDPTRRWHAQARFCRDEWRRSTPERVAVLIERLRREDHPIGRVWIDVLERRHPLATWLDGGDPPEALPESWSPSARQLVSSHPFTDRVPWSIPSRSPASSSTRHD